MAVLQKLKGNLAGAAKGIKSGSPKGHKTRLVLLALLFTLAFCVFVTATLFANSSYVPEDNVQELNYERSQVFVGGTGYTLTNYKKKQHDLEELRPIIRGGGSDSAYTVDIGIPTVCSMGAVGDYVHTVREYAKVDSLPMRAKILGGVIAEF